MRAPAKSTLWRGLSALLAATTACAVLAAQAPAPPPASPLTLTQALQRARANSPDFQNALVAQGIAHEDTTQARAALLPSASFLSSYLYTQGNRFIANNAVHEYVSQGNIHEDLSVAGTAELRHSRAAEALARAQAQVALYGLATTVAQDYYNLAADGRKIATAQQALTDSQHYLTTSQELENGGEAAHTDVLKAQLEVQQKQRELTEAQLAQTRAQLDLGVLLFKDFTQSYRVVDDLDAPPPLPDLPGVQVSAGRNNATVAAAAAGVNQAAADISVAHAALLPTLGLDYWYGIDAPQYAAHTPAGLPNLGSAAEASLNVPIFDWGANRSKLRQANLRQQQAKLELSAAQRQLQANLIAYHAEAQAAFQELATLATSRAQAIELLRLTGLRYEAGEATILELVDAQNTATDARNAYDDGQVRYRVALANLQALAGTTQP